MIMPITRRALRLWFALFGLYITTKFLERDNNRKIEDAAEIIFDQIKNEFRRLGMKDLPD